MLASPSRSHLTPAKLAEVVDFRRVEATWRLNPDLRSEFGQFLTPANVARFMASLFAKRPSTVNLLDAGAGVGSLTAACVATFCQWNRKPRAVTVAAFEVDTMLCDYLKQTLSECAALCEAAGVEFRAEVHELDFVTAAVGALSADFFASPFGPVNCAVLNPPYRKIHTRSDTRLALQRVGIETSNLYTAFVWLTARLLSPGGELVAITPRSFCNGSYFKAFRTALQRLVAFRRLHVFESRNSAFSDDAVLQETVIVLAEKTAERGSVLITESNDPEDVPTAREVPYAQLVRPDDPDAFIHIVPNDLEHEIGERMRSLDSTLGVLGLTVSTGRVIDFRARHLLRDQPAAGTVPLIYPGHFSEGFIQWPLPKFRKSNALALEGAADLTVPAGAYVLVKRFSAKEERRRVVAAVYDSDTVAPGPVGFENHLNYFHRNGRGLERTLAIGLAAFLNSTLLDSYFRQFNGHTQVNANDLRNLRYPSTETLLALGSRIGSRFPAQDDLDRIIAETLQVMPSDASDPIQAKKRIAEAFDVLKQLGVPRAQQNERSALTLLSLLGIRPDTSWKDATSPQRGITEMMDYFKAQYGVSYAPNTRETVRRQTVHQFIEIGLLVLNSDDPKRPINSPHNRCTVELNALKLLRTYGSAEWSTALDGYLAQASAIRALQSKAREMALIPVTLPNGELTTLSGGEQNELIREIIMEFCPRFTPGGIVVYLGDAGEKVKGAELSQLAALGVNLDGHGKMPDLVVHMPEKNWLVLIEAVTSHGPNGIKLSGIWDR